MKGKYLFVWMISMGIGTVVCAQNAQNNDSALSRLDTTGLRIPLNRQLFHDRITEEQKRIDLMDGKRDTLVHVSPNPGINQRASDALFRQVDLLKTRIELDTRIQGNNEKIKYLKYLAELVQYYTIKVFPSAKTREKSFDPALTPTLVRDFRQVMDMDIKGGSMEDLIQNMPYDVGTILVSIFADNAGVAAAGKVLFVKYCNLHTSYILPNITPYANEPFADSLIQVVALKRPLQLYDYAQAVGSPVANLIRRNTDPKVKVIVQMSESHNGMLFFPFIDDLLSGKKTMPEIEKALSADVPYYKMLVQTEIDYAHRETRGDTPMAMRNLTDMLQKKAVEIFVAQVNELHESPDPVRFKCLEPLDAQDLYYLMVLGEEDIFTSSYVYVYKKMMEKFPSHHGDSLLVSLNFDKFKKFIKMAASYNTLGDFLKSMSPEHSKWLMAAFVRGLEHTPDLEDAVDVADSYASINDPGLRSFLLTEVQNSYEKQVAGQNKRGEVIYNLLQTIFASTDSGSHINLTQQLGIPPIYSVNYKDLADDSGRVIMQVFFYGDKDGIQSYNDYLGLFNRGGWKITRNKEWVTIRSMKGRPIWIYANLPLDNIQDLDAQAQKDLGDYLNKEGLHPSVVIHRGHSYHVKFTIEQLAPSAKIVILGSCGGYKNLDDVLMISPDAHIISSKQTGTQTVNEPILRAIDDELLAGRNIEWIALWDKLAKEFKGNPTAMDRFSDYVPPHKNLGALFIKAYKIKMGEDED